MTRWRRFACAALLAVQAGLAAAAPAVDRVLHAQGLAGATWFTLAGADAAPVFGAAGSRQSGTPMASDTRVHVGSVAKVLVAAGVLRLASMGKLSLDAPVAALLPALAFDNRWEGTAPLRVRHLLAHTGGLDDLRLWQAFSPVPDGGVPLSAAFTRDPSVLRLRSAPGTRYVYSNMGYTLLGMVIEAATGQPYERWLDRELLAPLGMTDSTFAFVTQQADRRLAMGHFEAGKTAPAVRSWLRPAGQFTTTAPDMARFARFLMGDGTWQGRRLVDAASMARLARPEGTDAARAGLGVGHGFALAIRDRHGVVGACHPGTTVGFRAMLCLYPEHGRAFFWAANADSETADYEALTRALLAELRIPAPRAAPVVAGSPAHEWAGFYVPSPNSIAPYALVDLLFSGVRLSVADAGLRLDPVQGASQALLPAGGALYRATDRVEPSHVLLRGDGDARLLSNGLRTWERIAWWRIGLLWGSCAAGFAALAWIAAVGAWRALRGRPNALAWPAAAIGALLLTVPLFFTQSLLSLGERTPASVLLAVVTGLLPVVLAAALRRAPWRDRVALGVALQWMILAAWWGLVPLRLWG